MFGKKPTTGSSAAKPSDAAPLHMPHAPEGAVPVGGTAHLPATLPIQPDAGGLEVIASKKAAFSHAASAQQEVLRYMDRSQETPQFLEAKSRLISDLVDKIDLVSVYKLPEERRRQRIHSEAGKMLQTFDAPLTAVQIQLLQDQAIDEILGFGPLEPLLKDQDVADIMINTAKQIYVEKKGKIFLTDVTFINEQHLMAVIQRIVTRVGRRIDEASPMVDARLPDGSRFNSIIPPLALDGALVSIRKFKKSHIGLRDYVNYESLTPQMAQLLEICANIRLNIIISGGTGSGKTTLLNAMSQHIDSGERVITIEDAAELQLSQPHVLRLETRPASNEGVGEVTQRQLVRNALRMRPDRIILGEIRGDEVIDVLSAMNTGHDGSLATIHANSPRDCLSRLENLVNMSGVHISDASLRYQIASAVQVIVQLQRMRDGKRRITSIEEVVGREGDIIITQTLFSYQATGMDVHGNLIGEFRNHGIRPRFLERAAYFGREQELLECLNIQRRG